MPEYFLGSTKKEFDRLQIQSNIFDRTSSILLRDYIRPGYKVIEVGSGTGGATQIIASILKNNGDISCLEREKPYIEHISARLKYNGYSNFSIIPADAEQFIPQDNYDVLYARATIHHFQNPENFIQNYMAALNKGGLFIFEEPIIDGIKAIPESIAYSKLASLYFKLSNKLGINLDIGEQLSFMLKKYDFKILHHQWVQQELISDTEKKNMLIGWLDTMKESLLQFSLTDINQFNQQRNELMELIHSNATILLFPMVQIVAQKY